jgi:uncharacterized membrane-anchored protein YitT (DUF2179 family)
MGAIFGGLLMGAGQGVVFSRGATTGGADVAARLLKMALPHLQMGQLIMGIDLVIILLSGFVYGSINNVLYAVISLYICTSVLDAVLYGPNVARVAYIVSDDAAEIARAIVNGLTRGATLLHGEGAFTGDPKKVILCAVKRQQIASLKATVSAIDPNAFIILGQANEVLGEGFLRYDKDTF